MLEFSYIPHSVPLLQILRQGVRFTITLVRVQATYTPINTEVMAAVYVVNFNTKIVHFSRICVFVMIRTKKGRVCLPLQASLLFLRNASKQCSL